MQKYNVELTVQFLARLDEATHAKFKDAFTTAITSAVAQTFEDLGANAELLGGVAMHDFELVLQRS